MLPVPARLRLAGGIDRGRLLGAEDLGVTGEPKPEAMKGVRHRLLGSMGSADRRISVWVHACSNMLCSRCSRPCLTCNSMVTVARAAVLTLHHAGLVRGPPDCNCHLLPLLAALPGPQFMRRRWSLQAARRGRRPCSTPSWAAGQLDTPRT